MLPNLQETADLVTFTREILRRFTCLRRKASLPQTLEKYFEAHNFSFISLLLFLCWKQLVPSANIIGF